MRYFMNRVSHQGYWLNSFRSQRPLSILVAYIVQWNDNEMNGALFLLLSSRLNDDPSQKRCNK